MYTVTGEDSTRVPVGKYKPGMMVMFEGKRYKLRCACIDDWSIHDYTTKQCAVSHVCPVCQFYPWIIRRK